METSRFGLAIPLGTGITIEMVVDCHYGTAHAAAVDHYYGELVMAPDMLSLADAVLGSYFLESSALPLHKELIRSYRIMKGWTLEGWRSSVGARVKAEWTPDVEVFVLAV